MKWEKVKKEVGGWVYSNIAEGRDWETLSVILLDKCLTGQSKKCHSHDTFREYAEFAYQVIQNWDIRAAGRLRDIFPHYFPSNLKKGNLTCFLGENGWEIVKSSKIS